MFYCSDIFVTVSVVASGRIQESNPINRQLLETGGPGTWVAFRLATLFLVTLSVAVSLSLLAVVMSQRGPSGKIPVDSLEDVVVGSIILFYAFAIFHNLAALGPLGR